MNTALTRIGPAIRLQALYLFGGLAGLLLAAGTAQAAGNIERMQSSVVRILCIVSNDSDDTGSTTGSGFVVAQDEADTYIATNAHVVSCLPGANARLILFLGPQRQLPLSIEKVDTGRDLAILRAPHVEGHPPVRFADTANLQPGDHVTAIGFPGAADEVLELDDADIAVPTLTEGNIGRIVTGSDNGVRYIQHSAAINPGNSGGPLFNDSGNVIGINTLKALKETIDVDANGYPEEGRTSDGEGIGLAVDAAQVIAMMREVGLTPLMGYPFGLPPAALAGLAALVTLLLCGAAFVILLAWSLAPGRANTPQARLRVISGALFGTERAVNQAVVIGRDPSRAQLVFPAEEPGVSRRHCRVRYDGASFMFEVTDLESSSGTFFDNGTSPPQRIPPNGTQRLQPGNRIYIGSRQNCVALELV